MTGFTIRISGPLLYIIWAILFIFAYWAYEDAKRRYRRSGPAALWALLIVIASIFVIPGIILLLLYLALRPPMPVGKVEEKPQVRVVKEEMSINSMYDKLLSVYATVYSMRARDVLEKEIEERIKKERISREEAIRRIYKEKVGS